VLSTRALGVGICLGLSTLTGCATVPWPPPPGSCIQAFRGHGKGSQWRYTLQGTLVGRESVEDLVGATPEGRALVLRARRRSTTGLTLVLSGMFTLGGMAITVAVVGQPIYLPLLVPALATVVAGTTLSLLGDEPFRRAILDFDARVARDGTCPRPPDPPPPPPRRVVPDEEVLHPRYGPPPLGP
jgi:hypothetical protein